MQRKEQKTSIMCEYCQEIKPVTTLNESGNMICKSCEQKRKLTKKEQKQYERILKLINRYGIEEAIKKEQTKTLKKELLK